MYHPSPLYTNPLLAQLLKLVLNSYHLLFLLSSAGFDLRSLLDLEVFFVHHRLHSRMSPSRKYHWPPRLTDDGFVSRSGRHRYQLSDQWHQNYLHHLLAMHLLAYHQGPFQLTHHLHHPHATL